MANVGWVALACALAASACGSERAETGAYEPTAEQSSGVQDAHEAAVPVTLAQHGSEASDFLGGIQDHAFVSHVRAFRIQDAPGMKGTFRARRIIVPYDGFPSTDPMATVPITVRLYRSRTYPPSAGSLTIVASDSFALTEQGPGWITLAVDAQFRPSETAVLELLFERRDSPAFVPSFNAGPETAPSYYRLATNDAPLTGGDLRPLADKLPGHVWIASVEGVTFAGDLCSTTFPCAAGQGDCDTDAECAPGLVCGRDNGLRFGLARRDEACVEPHCTNRVRDADEDGVDCGGACGLCRPAGIAPGGEGYCSPTFRCTAGEGACSSSRDCERPLVCAANKGVGFDFPDGSAACVARHCTNGARDKGESAVDCGGECGRCVTHTVTLRQTRSDTILADFVPGSDFGTYVVARAYRLADYPTVGSLFHVKSVGLAVSSVTRSGAVDVSLCKSSAYPLTNASSLGDCTSTAVSVVAGDNFSMSVPFAQGLDLRKNEVLVVRVARYIGMSDGFYLGTAEGPPTAPTYWATDAADQDIDVFHAEKDVAVILPVTGTTD